MFIWSPCIGRILGMRGGTILKEAGGGEFPTKMIFKLYTKQQLFFKGGDGHSPFPWIRPCLVLVKSYGKDRGRGNFNI